MRYLFVGGPHDGEWHEVPRENGLPRSAWTLRQRQQARMDITALPPEIEIPWDRHTTTYYAMEWGADDERRWIYVPAQELKHPAYVLDLLLEGYKRR